MSILIIFFYCIIWLHITASYCIILYYIIISHSIFLCNTIWHHVLWNMVEWSSVTSSLWLSSLSYYLPRRGRHSLPHRLFFTWNIIFTSLTCVLGMIKQLGKETSCSLKKQHEKPLEHIVWDGCWLLHLSSL